MPSGKNYKRDYEQEYRTEDADRRAQRAARNRARRAFEQELGRPIPPGYDVDHIKPLSQGGAATSAKNLRLRKGSTNRSFPRTSSGAMKRRG